MGRIEKGIVWSVFRRRPRPLGESRRIEGRSRAPALMGAVELIEQQDERGEDARPDDRLESRKLHELTARRRDARPATADGT